MASVPMHHEAMNPMAADALLREFATRLTPVFDEVNYKLFGTSPQSLTYVRTYTPIWAIVVAVIAFPIGLLALLVKSEDLASQIHVTAVPHGPGTLLTIAGSAPPDVATAVSTIAQRLHQPTIPSR